METHTEISRQSVNLFSAEQVAKTIGADLEKAANEWLDVGAMDRAVFGGGQFSRYELQRVALVFELVKLGFSPSCARNIVREMEYDLQLVWTLQKPLASFTSHHFTFGLDLIEKGIAQEPEGLGGWGSSRLSPCVASEMRGHSCSTISWVRAMEPRSRDHAGVPNVKKRLRWTYSGPAGT